MKLKSISYLIIIAVLFINCDELKDAIEDTEVDITTSYTSTITIDAVEQDNPEDDVSFQESDAFDILNNPDVADAIGTPEQIKKVEILGISYEYKNFSGNVDAMTLNNTFFLATGFMNGQYFPVANNNIAEADLFGTQFNLSGDFSAVNSYASEARIFVYVYSGSVTDNPALFDIEVTVTAKVTVELNIDDL